MKKLVLVLTTVMVGVMMTPTSNAVFAANPIPNILAMDVRYTPDGNTDGYIFSFNVNTKPTKAQIRFYSSYENMKKSINVVHADNYNGANSNKPDFVYNIPAGKLKQGKISISLGMCGGELSGAMGSDGCQITNNALPAGEWYWSVYVEAGKSEAFAPIYTQDVNDFGSYKGDPHRQHATVDNNPENDGFGHIYVADHHNDGNGEAYHRHHVLGYSIGDDFADNNGSATNINVTKRYKLITKKLTNPDAANNRRNENNMMYSRRPAVAPDGRVYLADDGGSKASVQGPNDYIHGGIWVFDPAHANNIGTNGSTATLTRFLQGSTTEATSALAFYGSGANLQVIKMNTYSEFEEHGTTGTYPYQSEKWMNNGYVLHGVSNHRATSAGKVIPFKVSDPSNPAPSANKFAGGDASGCFSLFPTETGVWFCQHRDGTYATASTLPGSSTKILPDNRENVMLMFYKHTKDASGKITGGTRTFESYKYDSGNLTQKANSILQSTPGGGMTYQKRNGKEYLYVVNHEGNILEFEISNSGGVSPSLTNTKKYVTGNSSIGAEKGSKYGAISSMNFDYAGNLVATIGVRYGNTYGKPRDYQELVVYTMPYNRTNAQEIQAPNSCRYIPERMAQTYDKHEDIISPYLPGGAKAGKTCGLDFYRPMMKGSFNSICLPFSMTAAQIAASPYAGATIMQYTGASYRVQNGEGMVDFNFEEVTTINAGEPYLIKLKDGAAVSGMARFTGVTMATDAPDEVSMAPITGEGAPSGAKALYQGVFDLKTWSVVDKELFPVFVLMDKDRLGQVLTYGDMYGFRGYFRVQGLPTSTKAAISMRKPTATGLVDHKGQEVDIEKFMREGRVYIRVGEALYTIAGERVE